MKILLYRESCMKEDRLRERAEQSEARAAIEAQNAQRWFEDCQKAEAELDEVKGGLADAQRACVAAWGRENRLREALKKAEAELAEANEWIKDFGLENNKLVKERDRLREALKKAEAELAEANEWIKDFGLENNKLVKERDRLREALGKIKAELADAKSESRDSAKFYEWASMFYEKCCELDAENERLLSVLKKIGSRHTDSATELKDIARNAAYRTQRARTALSAKSSEKETHDNLMEKLFEKARDPNYSRVCEELAGGWIKQSNGSSDPLACKAGGERVQPDGTRCRCPNEDPEV